MLVVQDEEEKEHSGRDGEEPGEPRADGRLREGVDRADHAAAGEECAPDREPEGKENEPHAKDAQQIQTNIVRVDGQRSVYLPILKQGGDSNTIAVVDGIRDALAKLVDVPKQLVAKVVFDQSVFVKMAIENLLHESG